MEQNEFTGPVPVLDPDGYPQNFGWSKQPVFYYDSALTMTSRRQISESDRYIIFTPTHQCIFEIRDDGWLGHVVMTIISLRDKKRSTQSFRTLLPMGTYEMPVTSTKGSIRYSNKKSKLDFIAMEGGARIIKADIRNFGHNRSMRGEVVLSEPETAESIVTNQHWRNEKYAFRYTRCSPWYIAEGVIQFGSSEIIFTRGNAWGIFEWNRGIRPKEDIRYWAAGSGISKGKHISFAIGYSSADFSPGTENAFFIDGKLHKLDKITFHIPPSNWLKLWRFTSNNNRFEMTFTPHQFRIEKRRLLLYNSTRRQLCGFFSGRAVLDDGSTIEFRKITGFAERSKMKF